MAQISKLWGRALRIKVLPLIHFISAISFIGHIFSAGPPPKYASETPEIIYSNDGIDFETEFLSYREWNVDDSGHVVGFVSLRRCRLNLKSHAPDVHGMSVSLFYNMQ